MVYETRGVKTSFPCAEAAAQRASNSVTFGMTFRIWSISCSKSMCSSRSASSRTRCFSCRSEKPCNPSAAGALAVPHSSLAQRSVHSRASPGSPACEARQGTALAIQQSQGVELCKGEACQPELVLFSKVWHAQGVDSAVPAACPSGPQDRPPSSLTVRA